MSALSPCAACGRPCCANYTVSIVGGDAWMIGKYLFLPLESFLVAFPAADHAEGGFILEPGGPRHDIALDKVGRYQKGNPCVFWISLQEGYGRCGIYPYRPLVCQTYPAYHQGDVVALRDDVYCPARSWNLAGMDLALFRRRLYRFRMERELYAYVVEVWNRVVEQTGEQWTISQYYDYLMNLYERFHRVTALFPAEQVQRIYTHWGMQSPDAPNPLIVDLTHQGGTPEWRRLLSSLREAVDRYLSTRRQNGWPRGRAAA